MIVQGVSLHRRSPIDFVVLTDTKKSIVYLLKYLVAPYVTPGQSSVHYHDGIVAW